MSAGRQAPELSVVPPAGSVRGIVVVLPGGKEHDLRPLRRSALPVLRMRPFVRLVHRRVPESAIVLVRYRHRGWNDADPVDDVEFAVNAMQQTYGPVPVVLVGHSMGGRAALRSAGLPQVTAVVGLAPWIPNGEPVEQLAGRQLLLVHGSGDHTTSPDATAKFAARAAPVARELVTLRLSNTGHAMVRRASVWHRITGEFVTAVFAGSSITDIGADETGIVSGLTHENPSRP